MKKIVLFLSIGLAFIGSFAQNSKKTIITIDNKTIPLEEFVYIYEKNNSKQTNQYSKESLDENLALFINYQLKIKEAESRKMDTSKAFMSEYEGYRKQLAKPYLTDDEFLDKMTKEAYQRLLEDVNTSHILIKVDEFADPVDTLKAYNKALEVRKKITEGADFGQMAIEFSEDPSAQNPEYTKGYKGFLGYNTAFSFVYPYESAAYNTPVGKVSMPVRSKFGYHLIKVNEKRKNDGEVKVSHIMIDAKEGIDAQDSIAKRKLAFEIYQNLKSGGDWNELCTQHSDDKRTASTGGEMQAFQLDGKLRVPAFEYAAFALKNVGDISEPVKTQFGWHIIKLNEKIPVAPFDKIKDKLEKDVRRSDRFALSEEVLTQKLKKENKFKESKKVRQQLALVSDSTLLEGTWKAPASVKKTKTTFKLNKVKFNYGNFFAYLEKNQKPSAIKNPKTLMNQYYDKYVSETVYNYAEEHLAEKQNDYRLLLKEFRGGILFFDIMQKEVWNKASTDTTGIKNFYEANKEKYVKPLEYNATVYKAKDAETLNKIEQLVKAGKNAVEIKEELNKESSLNVNVESKIYEEGKEEWMKNLGDKKEVKIANEKSFVYVVVSEKIPAGIKPLNKCRGLVISDYQSLVEKEWVDSLRKKYPVVINQPLLKSLVK
jgi:peptidyl-prolyl cis-trans isomerase SurA